LEKHGGGAINSMMGVSYQTTVNGQQVSYDLTVETLEKLEIVKNSICELFAPVGGQPIQNATG
jgi:hypothetical protein